MITPITKRDPRKLYLERLVFMAALLIPAVFRGGFRPLTVCAVCVICCMFTDWVCCKLRRIKYDIKDPAVMFWGLCCGMLMPAGIPHVLAGLSAVICIALGKHIFGGNENLVFSPPAIAVAFHLLLSFRVWAAKLILALYSGFVNMFLIDKVRELCYYIIWKGVAL